MGQLSSFAVFLFFAISLIVPSGFSAGAALLSAGGLGVLPRATRSNLSREDKTLIAILFLYFLVGVAMNVIHGEAVREYDLPSRFLFAIPALILLRAYPPSPSMFWGGLIIGGVLAGLFTGWQSLFVLHDRAGGHTNPIQYGNISFIIGMLCMAGIGWAKGRENGRLWTALLIVGMIFGMLGSLFTASRGSWVGLPICVAVFYGLYGGKFKRAHVVGAIAALLVGVVAAYAIPQTQVKSRMFLVVSETKAYFNQKDAGTSIGNRFEMWRVGAITAAERPFTGWGKTGLVEREAELVKSGVIDPRVKDNNHVYNEWLDAMAKRGLPGLAVLLALYIYPFLLFVRRLKGTDDKVKPYALAGLFLIVNYFGFGFTQVFLAHNTGVMTFAFVLVIVWGLLRAEEDKAGAR